MILISLCFLHVLHMGLVCYLLWLEWFTGKLCFPFLFETGRRIANILLLASLSYMFTRDIAIKLENNNDAEAHAVTLQTLL